VYEGVLLARDWIRAWKYPWWFRKGGSVVLNYRGTRNRVVIERVVVRP
jgi:hypothetical protein